MNLNLNLKKMKRNIYKIKYDCVLKNKFNNEIIRGNIVNEKDIDSKHYWVMNIPGRGSTPLCYAKESWIITKGK